MLKCSTGSPKLLWVTFLMILSVSFFSNKYCYASLTISEMELAGLALSDNVSKAVELYGQPTSKRNYRMSVGGVKYAMLEEWIYDGLTIHCTAETGLIFEIRTSSPAYPVPRNVKVGDDVKLLKTVLGEPGLYQFDAKKLMDIYTYGALKSAADLVYYAEAWGPRTNINYHKIKEISLNMWSL